MCGAFTINKSTVLFTFQATASDKSPTDDSLFQLDGFDEEERLFQDDDVDTAFPQSDDEEISTDGACVCMCDLIDYLTVFACELNFHLHQVLPCNIIFICIHKNLHTLNYR